MAPLLRALAVVVEYEGKTYEINEAAFAIIGGFAILMTIIAIPLIILMFVDAWKIYKKMGRKGWEGIIPIYDIYVACRATGINPWWMLTIFVPPAFAILIIILGVRICEGLGKSTLFSVLTPMFEPICLTIIAFDSSEWDAKRINLDSASFLNDESFKPASRNSSKKAEEEDPWVEGKEVKKTSKTKKSKK